jgi:hypothetical protein
MYKNWVKPEGSNFSHSTYARNVLSQCAYKVAYRKFCKIWLTLYPFSFTTRKIQDAESMFDITSFIKEYLIDQEDGILDLESVFLILKYRVIKFILTNYKNSVKYKFYLK